MCLSRLCLIKFFLLFRHTIASAWCRHSEAMSFRKSVSNCWTTQALCFYIGVGTGHSIALHGDVAACIDLSPMGLQPWDGVDVSVLDGLVVDLRKSLRKALTFAREDVILSEQFGPVRQGAKVAMTSGTAEVVKVSENDHELSLRGPFGGIYSLDIQGKIKGTR